MTEDGNRLSGKGSCFSNLLQILTRGMKYLLEDGTNKGNRNSVACLFPDLTIVPYDFKAFGEALKSKLLTGASSVSPHPRAGSCGMPPRARRRKRDGY